jgi:hypothetical protein
MEFSRHVECDVTGGELRYKIAPPPPDLTDTISRNEFPVLRTHEQRGGSDDISNLEA